MKYEKRIKYKYCIECTDKTTGKIGDFIFKDDFVAISPIFNDFVLFLDYLKEHNMAIAQDHSFYCSVK